jgi:glucans biosynthesis protein C
MAAPGQRIHHLDALRCFCMLFGLLVHGATIGNNLLFEAVKEVSDHFRMATFFVVSGYFTAMVASRGDVATYLTNRSRLLLVPLGAGLVLLNPVTNWLIQLYHGGGVSFADYFAGGWRLDLAGPGVWHLHLWFLISLFLYALATPLLLRIGGSGPVTKAVARVARAGNGRVLLLLAAMVGLCVVVLRGIADTILVPMLPGSWMFLVQATCNYFAFFAAGLLAFSHQRLFDSMHQLFWLGLLLFGAAYFAQPLLADALPRGLERASYWLLRSGFIFLLVCALLTLARRLVTRGSPFLSRLTDGVYSFYLFHFLAIYVIANLMRPWTDNLYLTYAVILLVGYPLLFVIHERLIAPSRLMTFLFNGKTAARKVTAA